MVLQTLAILKRATRLFVFLTVLTGFVYPLIVTALGTALFPREAAGSLINQNGKVIGSELIAQKFSQPKYFLARPSAGDYATVPSGASNLAPTSQALRTAIIQRRSQLGDAPDDLLTTSGSGLDPHISPESAQFQVARVASARNLDDSAIKKMRAMIEANVESPTLGFLGKARVNVLHLNQLVDQEFP